MPHPVWQFLQTVAVGQTVTVVGWTAMLVQPQLNVTAANDTEKEACQPAVLHSGQAKTHHCPGIRSRVRRTVSKTHPLLCARCGTACCRRDSCCWPERAVWKWDFDQSCGDLSSCNLDGVCCNQCAVFVSTLFKDPWRIFWDSRGSPRQQSDDGPERLHVDDWLV